MWKEALITAGLSAALAAGPALAQQEMQEQPGQQRQEQPGQQRQEQPGQQMQEQQGQRAQQDQEGQQGQQGQQAQQGQQDQQGREAQYQGWPVFTTDGQKIGEVKEVQQGEGDQGQKLLVESGGFFGIGAKTVEISEDKYTAAQDRIQLSMTADEAKDLPEADEGS